MRFHARNTKAKAAQQKRIFHRLVGQQIPSMPLNKRKKSAFYLYLWPSQKGQYALETCQSNYRDGFVILLKPKEQKKIINDYNFSLPPTSLRKRTHFKRLKTCQAVFLQSEPK